MSSLPPSDDGLPPSDLPPLDVPADDLQAAAEDEPPSQSVASGAPAEEDPTEGAVPPGYDWPTHGGYLGCLFGLIVSCLLCGLVGAPIAEFSDNHLMPAPLAIGITLLLAVIFAVILGRVGWVLGKRFYREYPQPAGRRTWYQQQEEEERAERAQTQARTRRAVRHLGPGAGYTDTQR